MGNVTEKQPSTSTPEATITPVAAADAVYGKSEDESAGRYKAGDKLQFNGLTYTVLSVDEKHPDFYRVADNGTPQSHLYINHANLVKLMGKKEAVSEVETLKTQIVGLNKEIEVLRAELTDVRRQLEIARASRLELDRLAFRRGEQVTGLQAEIAMLKQAKAVTTEPDWHVEYDANDAKLKQAELEGYLAQHFEWENGKLCVVYRRDKPREVEKPVEQADQEAPEAVSLTALVPGMVKENVA